MEQKKIPHHLKHFEKSYNDKTTFNFCQQRINKEAEFLRRQTELVNRQIAQIDSQYGSEYGNLCKTAKLAKPKVRIKPRKKKRRRHPVILNTPESSLFHRKSARTHIFQSICSRIKRLIFGLKMPVPASDALAEAMIQKEQRCGMRFDMLVLGYIGELARKLEPVINEQDCFIQDLAINKVTQEEIVKVHRYERLIRYAMISIIELIELTKKNNKDISGALGKCGYLHVIRNMLMHAQPQAVCHHSKISAIDIAKVHHGWARAFLALKYLSTVSEESLKAGGLALKGKLIIPSVTPDLLEQRLWTFYQECQKRHLYRNPLRYRHIVNFQQYIKTILSTDNLNCTIHKQATENKLDLCFIIADLGEVVLQCQQLQQNQFHKTIAIRNHVAHVNLACISLEDIQEAVAEINREKLFLSHIDGGK